MKHLDGIKVWKEKDGEWVMLNHKDKKITLFTAALNPDNINEALIWSCKTSNRLTKDREPLSSALTLEIKYKIKNLIGTKKAPKVSLFIYSNNDNSKILSKWPRQSDFNSDPEMEYYRTMQGLPVLIAVNDDYTELQKDGDKFIRDNQPVNDKHKIVEDTVTVPV